MKQEQTALRNKTVVITGASSGVGRAAALCFAQAGAKVIVAARRLEALNELVTEIEDTGGKALAVQTDVTSAVAHEQLATAAADFGGGMIDIWVNNAGVLAVGTLEETPAEVSTRVIQVNLLGYLYGATAVLPYFKKQQYGVLINNISVGGWLPIPYGAAYLASKTGLWGLTGALQAELSPYPNIHVCGLYPAMLDTPGVQHAANFSGSVLTAAPPVFDPVNVARAMVKVAIAPRRSYAPDYAAPFMRLGYTFAPRLTGRIAEAIFSNYFRRAAKESADTGNLFDDNSPLGSIHGGWRTRQISQKKLNLRLGVAAAGLIGLSLLLRKALR